MELKKEEVHMKLSKQDIEKLRRKIQDGLTNVQNGIKLQIEKELLELLLFDVITLDKEKKAVIKLPVWSGEFLQKIDLSEVDFSDVSWDLSQRVLNYFEDDSNAYKYVEAIVNKFSVLGRNYIINYAGTNANIDLTTSFQAKICHGIIINKCNFSGLDFSKLSLESIELLNVVSSDISNTNLIIPLSLTVNAKNSNFSGIELSGRTINAYCCWDNDLQHFPGCILTNTGTIIFISQASSDYKSLKHFLKDAVCNNWVGCYVNGKKVLSPEEQATKRERLKAQYEQMKQETFDSVHVKINKLVNKR